MYEPPGVNNGHNCPQATNQPYRHTSERISRSALIKKAGATKKNTNFHQNIFKIGIYYGAPYSKEPYSTVRQK